MYILKPAHGQVPCVLPKMTTAAACLEPIASHHTTILISHVLQLWLQIGHVKEPPPTGSAATACLLPSFPFRQFFLQSL